MDRRTTAAALSRLSDEALAREPSLGTLLGRLAQAVDEGRTTEASGYINVLVFAPIAVTWMGLSFAATAYADMLTQRPDLVSQPFLLLWQQGFGGRLVLNFSTLALIDASLIGILIALSLALHTRSELRDAAFRTSVLLKESEIRALLGQASSLGALDIAGSDAESILADMAAEERRIYERASEREGQLFELEGVVEKLREAAARLESAADALARR